MLLGIKGGGPGILPLAWSLSDEKSALTLAGSSEPAKIGNTCPLRQIDIYIFQQDRSRRAIGAKIGKKLAFLERKPYYINALMFFDDRHGRNYRIPFPD